MAAHAGDHHLPRQQHVRQQQRVSLLGLHGAERGRRGQPK